MRQRIDQRRIITISILAGLALILFWLGLKAWHVARAAQSLQARQADVEQLLADGLTQIDPDAAGELVLSVRRDVVVLQRETAVFMPLFPYLTWLPRVGPLLEAAPPLMTMADAGTKTAVFAHDGLAPALTILQNESQTDTIPALVTVLDEADPQLVQAELAMRHVVTARQQIDNADDLPWRVRTLLQQADPWLSLAQDGLAAAQVLPEILGHEGERRYLILAQNENEIRATGGFITGAGELVVDNGAIVELTFQDANFVDAWADNNWGFTKPYDFPPQPYYDLMNIDLFLFRDANFWPDFPTSAQKAMELYRYGQESPPLDGVIAIDQHFLQLLLAAIGPVTLPANSGAINSQNVVDAMRAAWENREGASSREWRFDRKAFLSVFAGAIQQKIETDFGRIDPLAMVQNMVKAIETRHLQVYVTDPDVAAVLDELGWNGRLHNDTGQDFLAVIESNFGYNKVNPFTERHYDYQVMLDEEEAVAQLTLTYHHTGPDSAKACTQFTSYQDELSYEDLTNRCYWNYLRIYTPAGSELVAATEHRASANAFISGRPWNGKATIIDDPSDLTTISNFMLLPRAETMTSEYTYRLPPEIVQSANGMREYELVVRKQAGLAPQPITVSVELPQNATLLHAMPEPADVNGRLVQFEAQLDEDLHITLTYR